MSIVATAIERVEVSGSTRKVTGTVVFGGNYATGGEGPLSAASFGLSEIIDVKVSGAVPTFGGATGMVVTYSQADKKLLCYESGASGAPLAEKGNAEAHTTAPTVRLVVEGY